MLHRTLLQLNNTLEVGIHESYNRRIEERTGMLQIRPTLFDVNKQPFFNYLIECS